MASVMIKATMRSVGVSARPVLAYRLRSSRARPPCIRVASASTCSHVSLPKPDDIARNVRDSSRSVPMMSGTAAAHGDAIGSNGCAGSAMPSRTGASCARGEPLMIDSMRLPPEAATWASIKRSTGSRCSWSMLSTVSPTSWRTRSARSVPVSGSTARSDGPLWMIALWKRPCADGMPSRIEIFMPPPDSPKSVTLPGSPPKRAMLSRIHSSAATRSRMPTMPETVYSSGAS